MQLSQELNTKLEHMKATLQQLESVAVAYSGGVDSSLILAVALDALGAERVVAVTGRSASVAESQIHDAAQLATQLGVKHVLLDTDEFHNEHYLKNPTNRCYHCKQSLYTHMGRFCDDHGIRAIVNGTNADDLGDWRPGIQAAAEHGVHSPAAEAGLTKSEIRELSRGYNLPTAEQPANPCLSSRVQYGERITPEKLRMIEKAEDFLKSLGIRECRVRHHGTIARIEVHPHDMAKLTGEDARQEIDRRFRDLGYNYVTLDLRGFRSGSMNEVIRLPVTKPTS